MKLKKSLKRSLSVVLCASMLINPATMAYAQELPGGIPRSPEITEEYLADKIPAYFYIWEGSTTTEPDGSLFKGQSPYFKFKANISISVFEIDKAEVREVEKIDLGDFYSGTEVSMIAGLPTIIRDKYGDRSKYNVNINVKPIDLPDDLVLSDEDFISPLDEYTYEYNNEDKVVCDIIVRQKVVHEQTGVISLKAPEKREYNIGEKFSVKGGSIRGNGEVVQKGYSVLNWDIFQRDLTLDDLDISEFDSTKPGKYLIKAKKVNYDMTACDEVVDKIVYDSFYVTVKGDEDTAEKKKCNFKVKASGIDWTDEDFFTGITLNIKAEIIDYTADVEPAEVIDCGKYKLADGGNFTLEVPSKYSDTERYAVYFLIESDELPEYRDHYIIVKKNYLRCDFESDDPIIITLVEDPGHPIGSRYIATPPKKRMYKVGEELDLTGATKRGSGQLSGGVGYWDDFGSPVTIDEVDISDFDNTKPGVYTIKGKSIKGEFDVYVYSEDDMPASKVEFEVQKHIDSSDYTPVNGLSFNIKAMVLTDEDKMKYAEIDCGTYDTKDGNKFTFEIPEEIMKLHNENKLAYFIICSDNVPEGLCLYNYDHAEFRFNGEPETKATIELREPVVATVTGTVGFVPPTKLVYSTYEKFDFSDAEINADIKITYPDRTEYRSDIGYTDIFDTSGVDISTPGEYTVKLRYTDELYDADIVVNELEMPEFKITVQGKKKSLSKMRGDANLDNEVSLADAVTIMQFIANPDKHQLSEQAMINSDITGDNDGVTSKDALVIQKYKLKLIDSIE